MLTVTEIFAGIQGETSFSGLPFVFARLTGCNLRCRYCDTTYAYGSGQKLGINEILSLVTAFGLNRVCITGGEPMIQENTPLLARELLDRGHQVLVETNGAISLSGLDPRAVKIMDVKCPDSGEHENMLWENFRLLTGQDEVKFVISSRQDYAYAKDVLEKYRKETRWSALFSPVFGLLPFDQLAEWILEDALDVRFQLQIHKLVWGPDRKGV
ncbi:MAG: radical SAM protein [Syntrophorhabdaceae bacterium]|nr:radical SAM protein [Syntrophorhabdaceae bacterium]